MTASPGCGSSRKLAERVGPLAVSERPGVNETGQLEHVTLRLAASGVDRGEDLERRDDEAPSPAADVTLVDVGPPLRLQALGELDLGEACVGVSASERSAKFLGDRASHRYAL